MTLLILNKYQDYIEVDTMFLCFYFRYGGIRGSYQHFGSQGGQDTAFPSPRGALGYPFPPMHQNSYSGYHLGSYAPPCASPPKDGKFLQNSVPLSMFILSLTFYTLCIRHNANVGDANCVHNVSISYICFQI